MDIPSQIPLADSHERSSVRDTFGSIRDLKVENGQLIGRAYFASDPASQETFEKYADGHLTDFSVGASRDDVDYLEDGTQVVTRSTLIEGSAVVSGGDPKAKATLALRAYSDPHGLREELMFEELKAKMVERGLPADADDDALLDFIVERTAESTGDEQDEMKDILRGLRADLAKHKQQPRGADDETQAIIERKRITSLNALADEYSIEAKVRDEWIERGDTVEDATTFITRQALKRLNEQVTGVPIGPGTRTEGGQSEREKFYEAARQGVITRPCRS
jgi:hypothetical protein